MRTFRESKANKGKCKKGQMKHEIAQEDSAGKQLGRKCRLVTQEIIQSNHTEMY